MRVNILMTVLVLTSFTTSQPILLQIRQDPATSSNSISPAGEPSPAPPSPPPPPAAQDCRCTVVFGDKAAAEVVNVKVDSTTGLTGQDGVKKACSANLIVGTGCSSATADESSKSCVKSQTCIAA